MQGAERAAKPSAGRCSRTVRVGDGQHHNHHTAHAASATRPASAAAAGRRADAPLCWLVVAGAGALWVPAPEYAVAAVPAVAGLVGVVAAATGLVALAAAPAPALAAELGPGAFTPGTSSPRRAAANSPCALAGSVVESSWMNGSCDAAAVESTKSPKLLQIVSRAASARKGGRRVT
jgi:hypothetical protein